MKAKRGIICSLAALALLLAVVVVVAQWDMAKAAIFEPTVDITLSDNTAGANADITNDFNVPAGGANYNTLASFTPTEFALGADVPLGAYAGHVDALATLGLLNQPCITPLEVPIDLLNASVNTADTVTWEDSYIDMDGDTLADGVTKYPDLLTRMFPGATPVARHIGVASAAGTAVTLNVIFFEPGSPLFGAATDAALGRPTVWVLNDIGDPGAVPVPGAITDFCAPLTATITTFGVSKTDAEVTPVEGGDVVSINPTTGGDYTFTTVATSNLDTDGDDVENPLDTCPYDVNTGQDGDSDAMDDVCDPDPALANTDYDDDGFQNAGDNCPLVANVDQADGDVDSIGDACDQDPATADGAPISVTLTETVTITGAAPAETPTVAAETPTVAPTPSPAASPAASPTPSPTPTPTPTPTVPAPVGGAGLLGSDDGGFPVWAMYVIGVAAALMLGGIGTAATVVWRRRQ